MLIKKAKYKVDLKIYDFTTSEIINQTMKFGQLIEYNMRNIVLEKSHTNSGGEIDQVILGIITKVRERNSPYVF